MSDHDTRTQREFSGRAELSASGQAREVAILDVLHRAAAARRTRRTAVRRGVTVALTISLGAVLFRMVSPGKPTDRAIVHETTPSPTEIVTPAPELPPSVKESPINANVAARSVAVSITTNHDLTMSACDAPAAPGKSADAPNVCLLNDDQLLAALAETGETYGLVRAAGRVEVVRNGP